MPTVVQMGEIGVGFTGQQRFWIHRGRVLGGSELDAAEVRLELFLPGLSDNSPIRT